MSPFKPGLFSVDGYSCHSWERNNRQKAGRRGQGGGDVFDSTGVAIEDLAVARMIYDKAIRVGTYKFMDFIEG